MSKRRWHQLVRFGMVGVANTIVYYGTYRILLVISPYLMSHLLAWSLSVVFSFFVNCRFTYRVKPTWRRFLAFPLGVATNFVFTTAGTILLVEMFNFSTSLAPLLCGIAAIPATFAVTTFALTNRRIQSEGFEPSKTESHQSQRDA